MSDRRLDQGQPPSPGAVGTLLPPFGPAREVLQALSIGLVVFAAAWSSLALIQHTGRVAPLWPANAVVLVCLLRSDGRRWPGFVLAGLVGNLAADLITGDKLYVAVGLSLANALEIVIGAYGLRRLAGRDIDLTRRRDLLAFGALAGVVAPVLSAWFAMSWLRLPINQNFWPNFSTWVLADALGAVILVPALLALTPAAVRSLWAPRAVSRNLLLLTLLIAVMTAVFAQSRYPLGILVLPALLLIIFKLEFIGAALGVLLTAVISLGFTLNGQGPATMVDASLTKQVLALQIFLAVATFSILPVASALARARRLQASLATSLEAAEAARAESVEAQRWARMAEQTASVGYWRLPTRGKSHWSPEVFRIHGLDPSGPADSNAALSAVHPDDMERVLEGLKAARAEGRSFEGVYRIRRTDGCWRTVSCRTVSEKDNDDKVVAVIGTLLDITEFKQIEAAALESVAGQLTQAREGAIKRVTIEYEGLAAALNTRPLTAAALAGLMSPLMVGVNMVNAAVAARDHGIDVAETVHDRPSEYQTLVRITIGTEGMERSVAGTLFAGSRPRIVEIKGIKVEADFAPHMLYVTNQDKPGFIGRFGATLAGAGINIATFHLGRANQGGDAICLVSVDDGVPEDVLAMVRTLPLVVQATALAF